MLKQRLSRAHCFGVSLIMCSFLISQYNFLPVAAAQGMVVKKVAKSALAQDSTLNPASQQPDPTAEIVKDVSGVPKASVAVAAPVTTTNPCVPNGSYSTRPVGIALSSPETGLYEQHDAPYFYQVFGSTAEIIRQQLRECGPSKAYAAEFSYTINWSYDTNAIADGICKIATVKIGLRTQILLPAWQANEFEESILVTKWQNFISHTYMHEQEHVAIAKQYAQEMYSSLQQLTPGSCADISVVAASIANNIAARLRIAEQVHDDYTQHGITQGALF